MLVLFVLCACLRTLQGAPLLPPHASGSANLMAREDPVDPGGGGPQSECRTVNSILQSCLLTIFACVWTSAHANINGPRDSDWTCLKRKIVTMLCVITAPELVLLWALNQRSSAKTIAKRYNKLFAESGQMVQESLWGRVMGWFLPLSKEATWRGDGQSWTTTHGFFVQMGGFILYDNGYPKEVLDYYNLKEHLEKKCIDAPTVTERDLQDRSKGDTISKAIVVLQTTWFVLQCIARAEQRLPLSELEVLTLAFAVLNVAIYAAWWNKPQGVDTAICVPLKHAQNVIADFTTPTTSEEQQHDTSVLSDLRRQLREDREHYSLSVLIPTYLLVVLVWLPVLLVCVPSLVFHSVLRLLTKLAYARQSKIEKNDLRVPMFYAFDAYSRGTILASCVIGTIFGAVHLLAWASEFPSPRHLVLWRVSAILLAGMPFAMFLGWYVLYDWGRTRDVIVKRISAILLLLSSFYIAARFVVIVIALLAIRHPPQNVLRNVSWTSYIPHF